MSRLEREKATITAMARLYCHHRHQTGNGLCAACQELVDYAFLRIGRCRYGSEKPTCKNCPTHCYKPERQEQVRQIMRFAGPRMLYRHPILAVWHLLDDRKDKKSAKAS